MKNITKGLSIFLMLFCLIFTACSSDPAQNCVNRMEKIVKKYEQIKEKSKEGELTIKEQAQFAEEMSKLEELCAEADEDNFTPEQERKIGKLSNRIQKLAY